MAIQTLMKMAAKRAQGNAARQFLKVFVECKDHNDPCIKDAARHLIGIKGLDIIRNQGFVSIVRQGYIHATKPSYVAELCVEKLQFLAENSVSREYATRVAYEVACWSKGREIKGLEVALVAGVVAWDTWELIEALDGASDYLDVTDLFSG